MTKIIYILVDRTLVVRDMRVVIPFPFSVIIWIILFMLAYWVYEDAKRRYNRGGPAALWALLTALGSIFIIPGIIILLLYLALRPPMILAKEEKKEEKVFERIRVTTDEMYNKLLSAYATAYGIRGREILEKDIERLMQEKNISRDEAIKELYGRRA